MRILQLIDSLETGGAERMAVNYANALATKIPFSGIVATRKEGALRDQIDKEVSYLFINKKFKIDFNAVYKLLKFIKKNQVTLIHAHSSSFFIAFLVKLFRPSLQLVWHDHYGNSNYLKERPSKILKIILPFFNGIIVVNQHLKDWSEQILNFEKVLYLANFPSSKPENILDYTMLKGNDGKKILVIANLREQKNHFFLLKVAEKIKFSNPDWSFHLVGKDFNDRYSQKLKIEILDKKLSNTVFIYGSKTDIKNILTQIDIAILTSKSEGLPVALLEYGFAKKPVVATNVGQISSVIENGINGYLVASNDEPAFCDALQYLIDSEISRLEFGKKLSDTISKFYSKETIINQYLLWLKTI